MLNLFSRRMPSNTTMCLFSTKTILQGNMKRPTQGQNRGLWVWLAVICCISAASIEAGSKAVQIQTSPAFQGVTDQGGSNIFDLDIKDDNSSEVGELWHRILLRLSSAVSSHTPSSDGHARRSRRYVFGKDNRVRVNAETYPFSTVVLLSVGCTGTLVGPRHVLTAAHCIHSGRKYLTSPRKIRIGNVPISSRACGSSITSSMPL